MRVLKASERLLEDTLLCDGERVAEGLDRAHMEISSILSYNDENSLSCVIGLAYYSARKDYRLIREMPAGRGFADIVFLPLPHTGKPALVVELKYNQSADSALRQIRERRYTHALEGFAGDILLVGISYDKNHPNKPHSCVIEKLVAETGERVLECARFCFFAASRCFPIPVPGGANRRKQCRLSGKKCHLTPAGLCRGRGIDTIFLSAGQAAYLPG